MVRIPPAEIPDAVIPLGCPSVLCEYRIPPEESSLCPGHTHGLRVSSTPHVSFRPHRCPSLFLCTRAEMGMRCSACPLSFWDVALFLLHGLLLGCQSLPSPCPHCRVGRVTQVEQSHHLPLWTTAKHVTEASFSMSGMPRLCVFLPGGPQLRQNKLGPVTGICPAVQRAMGAGRQDRPPEDSRAQRCKEEMSPSDTSWIRGTSTTTASMDSFCLSYLTWVCVTSKWMNPD